MGVQGILSLLEFFFGKLSGRLCVKKPFLEAFPMLIVLCIVGWAATFSDSILFPVVPLYAADLGASVSQAGFIIAIYSYVTALLTIPSGRVSDKVGVSKAHAPGPGDLVVAPLLYPVVTRPERLIWVRMFHGLAYAFFLPSAFAARCGFGSTGKAGRGDGMVHDVRPSRAHAGPRSREDLS